MHSHKIQSNIKGGYQSKIKNNLKNNKISKIKNLHLTFKAWFLKNFGIFFPNAWCVKCQHMCYVCHNLKLHETKYANM